MTQTYQQGTKGEGVRLLQRLLIAAGMAVTADGDYGPRTAEAVRTYQRRHGLSADGVAGEKTIRSLTAVTITEATIRTHITRCAQRTPRYLALHYTAGSRSTRGTALQTRQVFLSRQASADFVVDDETIVRINPDPSTYYCWAAGDKRNPYTGGARLYGLATNRTTVSIEICSTLRPGTTAAVPNHDGWSFTDRSLEQARRLTRYLMLLYGIPPQNVIRHYDCTGKLCPGIPGWNDGPLYSATTGKQLAAKNNSREWEKWKASL